MIAPTTAATIDPINTKYAEEPAADQRAKNANNDVPGQAKPAAPHDLPSDPAGDGADHQENNETCECHVVSISSWRTPYRSGFP